MPLLSDREGFDRLANARAQAGIASRITKHPWSIFEAAQALKTIAPVNEDELTDFVRLCEMWGVVTNVSHEPWWKRIVEEGTT